MFVLERIGYLVYHDRDHICHLFHRMGANKKRQNFYACGAKFQPVSWSNNSCIVQSNSCVLFSQVNGKMTGNVANGMCVKIVLCCVFILSVVSRH